MCPVLTRALNAVKSGILEVSSTAAVGFRDQSIRIAPQDRCENSEDVGVMGAVGMHHRH